MITKGTIKSKEYTEMPKPPRVWELKDNISIVILFLKILIKKRMSP